MQPKVGTLYLAIVDQELRYAVYTPIPLDSDHPHLRYDIITSDALAQRGVTQQDRDAIFNDRPDLTKIKDNMLSILAITAQQKNTHPNAQYIEGRTAHSDHLPIANDIGVSWNIGGVGTFDSSGFQYSDATYFYETDESGRVILQQNQLFSLERYRLVGTALQKMVVNRKLICLQEANEEIVRTLNELLNPNEEGHWDFIWRGGKLIAYKKSEFDLQEDSIIDSNEVPNRYLKATLIPKGEIKTPLDVFSWWIHYNEFPDTHEELFRKAVQESFNKGHDVFGGADSNCFRFEGSELRPVNSMTGLIPTVFLNKNASVTQNPQLLEAYQRDSAIQCPDAPDIIITGNALTGEMTCHYKVMNYEGEYHEEPIVKMNSNSPQGQVMNIYKSCMLITDQERQKFHDFFKLQEEIKTLIGDNAMVSIRPAKNAYSNLGMSIAFPRYVEEDKNKSQSQFEINFCRIFNFIEKKAGRPIYQRNVSDAFAQKGNADAVSGKVLRNLYIATAEQVDSFCIALICASIQLKLCQSLENEIDRYQNNLARRLFSVFSPTNLKEEACTKMQKDIREYNPSRVLDIMTYVNSLEKKHYVAKNESGNRKYMKQLLKHRFEALQLLAKNCVESAETTLASLKEIIELRNKAFENPDFEAPRYF